jgi:hypothetical protein
VNTVLCFKHVAEMRTFLANSIRARSFGLQKAAYKTAADTSFTYHTRSTWQTGRCPYKLCNVINREQFQMREKLYMEIVGKYSRDRFTL